LKISGICSSHGYYKGESCPKCEEVKKVSSPYGFVRTERGKRTDIEFRSQTIDDNISEMNQRRWGA